MSRSANFVARNALASAAAEEWRGLARRMRAEGRKLADIAAAVGRSVSEVSRQVGDVPYTKVERALPSVPAWVRRAGLSEDFRDVAREADEFAAAAHCRRLTSEMRAPA